MGMHEFANFFIEGKMLIQREYNQILEPVELTLHIEQIGGKGELGQPILLMLVLIHTQKKGHTVLTF